MPTEIERKFLIKNMPDLSKFSPIGYERCFLFIDETSEIRIQRKGETYELERKISQNLLRAKKQKIKISAAEYNTLKLNCEKTISRESYILSQNPEISIKFYRRDFNGLIRVEVEFSNEKEAQDFEIPDWYGAEITDSPLGRDSKLIRLSDSEFQELLKLK